MNFLSQSFGGMPLWIWGVILAGGIALAYFGPKLLGGLTGSSNQGGSSQATLPSNIDPVTGVPYSVEESINPGTGLPAYYGTGPSTGTTSGPTPSWGNTPIVGQQPVQGYPVIFPISGGGGSKYGGPIYIPRMPVDPNPTPGKNQAAMSGVSNVYGSGGSRIAPGNALSPWEMVNGMQRR